MKRFILILSLVLLCFSTLYAQRSTFQNEFYLGAGGGASATSMDFVPSISQTDKLGFQGGISAKYISQNHVGLIVEVNFSQRGWEEEFDEDSDFSYSRTLNYIEIPFMTHVYFGKKTRFIFNIGPQIGLRVGDKQDMNQALADDLAARREDNPDLQVGYQYSPTSEMKRFDYGLIGGIGVELQTGIGIFDLEGRYYFGLGDVFTSRRSENAYFSRSAHRMIEARLTYYLKIR